MGLEAPEKMDSFQYERLPEANRVIKPVDTEIDFFATQPNAEEEKEWIHNHDWDCEEVNENIEKRFQGLFAGPHDHNETE